MIVAGDEFARTQNGNNNAYCQDSEIGWINWELDADGKSLLKFVKRLIKLRMSYPILRRGLFLVGHYNEELGIKDVTWLAPEGTEMSIEQWEDPNGRCLGILLDGRAQVSGVQRAGADDTLLITVNSQHDAVDFTLPEVPEGSGWTCKFDTYEPDFKNRETLAFNSTYSLNGRSMALFELIRTAEE